MTPGILASLVLLVQSLVANGVQVHLNLVTSRYVAIFFLTWVVIFIVPIIKMFIFY